VARASNFWPTQRRLLQIAVGLGACVPVSAGVAGVLMGTAMTGMPAPIPASLDSHFRYLSGLLLAIGLGFWSSVPSIERKGGRFRLLAGLVFAGGLGRAVSLAAAGQPGAPMLAGLAMELLVAPLLALWQFHVARSDPQSANSHDETV
jgi:hypothetical protein